MEEHNRAKCSKVENLNKACSTDSSLCLLPGDKDVPLLWV